jgi:hypothetical protein
MVTGAMAAINMVTVTAINMVTVTVAVADPGHTRPVWLIPTSGSLSSLPLVVGGEGGLPCRELACCHLAASFALNSARVGA